MTISLGVFTKEKNKSEESGIIKLHIVKMERRGDDYYATTQLACA